MPKNRKILIVDDETDLCMLLKDYFVRKNYEVVVSHTLTEGKHFLKSGDPGILFLDNNLPDGEGWKDAPGIAKEFPEVYIVLISAFHSVPPDMPINAQYRVIEKPIRFSDLDKEFSDLI